MYEQDEGSEMPSTLPAMELKVKDFTNESAARSIGSGVLSAVHEIGKSIDVSSMDAITIAIDYDLALKEVDRGIEGLRDQQRTNDGVLSGVAKAIAVKRGDQIKTHIVFHAGPLACFALDNPEEDDVKAAIAIIAHECAHVEEHAWRENQFPGTILNKQVHGFVPAYMQQFAEAFWCEYAVCRLSATFARTEEGRFRESLELRLGPARETAVQAIRSYRIHGDVLRVFAEVGIAVVEPLRMASYLFGHLDGLAENDLPQVGPELPTQDDAFVHAITQLVYQLRGLWEQRNNWKSHDDMLILGQTAFSLMQAFGIEVEEFEDGGAHINVPFTPETYVR